MFAGVGKTDAELELGLAQGIGDFNAESEDEIVRLAGDRGSGGDAARVSLRVNPDIDPRSHPYISTGLRENKFGVDIAQAPEILRARPRPARRRASAGLQCHIGSQITDLAPARGGGAGARGAVAAGCSRTGFPCETIDLGGGLGVDYEEGSVPEPAALAAPGPARRSRACP